MKYNGGFIEIIEKFTDLRAQKYLEDKYNINVYLFVIQSGEI